MERNHTQEEVIERLFDVPLLKQRLQLYKGSTYRQTLEISKKLITHQELEDKDNGVHYDKAKLET